jgi:two-component system, NarL family, invasion response regulator UvrY
MTTIHEPEVLLVKETGKKTFMTNRQIRVVIIDDHAGVREGLKNLLSTTQDIVVVGEGENGAAAIELVATKNPDILLLDMELPDQRGDIVMGHIHDMQPEIKVLGVSSYTDRDYILGMMEHGAAGYITKDEAPTMLVDAIRNVMHENGSWFSPVAVKNSSPTSIEQQTLTKREVQILEHLIRDRSVDEIAAAVGISKAQVEKFLKLLMKKYETESLASLKQIARRVLSQRSN